MKRRASEERSPVRGILILPDKTLSEVSLRDYRDYQDAVDGTFEIVTLSDGSGLCINDGSFSQFGPEDFNSIASDVAGLGGRPDLMLLGLVGPAVMVGPVDDEGNSLDVTDQARRWIERVSREAGGHWASLRRRTASVHNLAPSEEDEFFRGFAEAGIWADGKEYDSEGVEEIGDLDPSWWSVGGRFTLEARDLSSGWDRLVADVDAVLAPAADLIAQWVDEGYGTWEQAGHNSYLTSRGHGAGWGEEYGPGEELARQIYSATPRNEFGGGFMLIGEDDLHYEG